MPLAILLLVFLSFAIDNEGSLQVNSLDLHEISVQCLIKFNRTYVFYTFQAIFVVTGRFNRVVIFTTCLINDLNFLNILTIYSFMKLDSFISVPKHVHVRII